jgi:hypothetical protein
LEHAPSGQKEHGSLRLLHSRPSSAASSPGSSHASILDRVVSSDNKSCPPSPAIASVRLGLTQRSSRGALSSHLNKGAAVNQFENVGLGNMSISSAPKSKYDDSSDDEDDIATEHSCMPGNLARNMRLPSIGVSTPNISPTHSPAVATRRLRQARDGFAGTLSRLPSMNSRQGSYSDANSSDGSSPFLVDASLNSRLVSGGALSLTSLSKLGMGATPGARVATAHRVAEEQEK